MNKILTPIKAIRKNCLDCCGDSYKEVELCEIDYCPLYPYRLGKRPKKMAVEPIALRTTGVCKQKATRPMSFNQEHGNTSNQRRPSDAKESKGDGQGTTRGTSPSLTLDGREE